MDRESPMQCPSCDHEAPQEAFGNPLRCPDCGIFYEKAVAMKLRANKVEQAPQPAAEPVSSGPARLGPGMIHCYSCKSGISKSAKACPVCGAQAKKKTSLFTWIVAIIIVIWVVGSFSGGPSSTKSSSTSTPAPAPKVDPLKLAKSNTSLEYDWSKSAGGALMQATFTITNKGTVDIKDIEITCTHYGASGTEIDSNTRTIYEIVKASSTRTFKNFDMGFIHSQAVTTSCQIEDLKI